VFFSHYEGGYREKASIAVRLVSRFKVAGSLANQGLIPGVNFDSGTRNIPNALKDKYHAVSGSD